MPYLRGYGPTRFRDERTPRSGEQAALGADLRDFMDALGVERALLAGFDWGGRAACIASALWPARVRGLVTCGGYNLQNIAAAARPAAPETEHRLWYTWYLNTERGRAGLAANRRAFARLLWSQWSPHWRFDDATFERTAPSFDNPDFVDVVVHSYRHRYGYVAGDPELRELDERLRAQPPIAVPAINLEGGGSGLMTAGPDDRHAAHFTGPYARRVLPGIGHAVPHEAPAAVVAALRDLR